MLHILFSVLVTQLWSLKQTIMFYHDWEPRESVGGNAGKIDLLQSLTHYDPLVAKKDQNIVTLPHLQSIALPVRIVQTVVESLPEIQRRSRTISEHRKTVQIGHWHKWYWILMSRSCWIRHWRVFIETTFIIDLVLFCEILRHG